MTQLSEFKSILEFNGCKHGFACVINAAILEAITRPGQMGCDVFAARDLTTEYGPKCAGNTQWYLYGLHQT